MSRNIAGVGELLKPFIVGIELLEEQKAEIALAIKEMKTRAVKRGFNRKVINKILQDRKTSIIERQEFESQVELYRAALGMLHGSPLGDAARQHLIKFNKPLESNDDKKDDADPKSGDDQPAAAAPAPTLIDERMIEAARERGREDARAKKSILENPFVAGDPRRAGWDEGWCEETGTDGMEIPDAWRPKKKEKKSKPEEPKLDGAGGEQTSTGEESTEGGDDSVGGDDAPGEATTAGDDSTSAGDDSSTGGDDLSTGGDDSSTQNGEAPAPTNDAPAADAGATPPENPGPASSAKGFKAVVRARRKQAKQPPKKPSNKKPKGK